MTAEICLVGSMFKSPDLYVTYGNFMRPQYDFADKATRFFYENFEKYYLTFSQTVDETKLNVFMSQNEERLRQYREYHGWRTVVQYMNVADETDCKNYYNTVKKYSLLREYDRVGFPASKIMSSKKFDTLTADDIYRLIRIKADKIHTVINAGDEAVDLTQGNEVLVDNFIDKPAMGLPTPWTMYNEYFLGLQEQKVIFEGFLSNEGKTRKLMLLAAYVALIQKKPFLFMSNEMSEEDMRKCLITTVLNNKEFQELHGVHTQKPEREIVLGVYHDSDGKILRRRINEQGQYIETFKEFIGRLQSNSEDYRQVKQATKWLDENGGGNLLFKDMGKDYSDRALEFEIRKAKAIKNITYYAYDTMKGYKGDDWSPIKQTATLLKEVTKELKMSGFCVFQLTDDTVYTDVFELSSNNIANCKHLKHVVDGLTLGKKISRDDMYKYQYMSFDDDWGEPTENNLDPKKTYFAIKIDKNRSGDKDKIMLFEINLNFNTWENIGWLIKKKKD